LAANWLSLFGRFTILKQAPTCVARGQPGCSWLTGVAAGTFDGKRRIAERWQVRRAPYVSAGASTEKMAKSGQMISQK
jgi:hypothetical protein